MGRATIEAFACGVAPSPRHSGAQAKLASPESICGRLPVARGFGSFEIGSLAIICPACVCGRTGPLAKMVSATRVPNIKAGYNDRWGHRSISRLGSIDRTICSVFCKFRYEGSMAKGLVMLLRVSVRSLCGARQCWQRGICSVGLATHHDLPGNASDLVRERHGCKLRRLALEQVDEPG